MVGHFSVSLATHLELMTHLFSCFVPVAKYTAQGSFKNGLSKICMKLKD